MERRCMGVINCILVPTYWFPHSTEHLLSQTTRIIHPILSVLRRPCRVPEAMAFHNDEGQSLRYSCQSKWNWSRPVQTWWNRVMEPPVGSEWGWQQGGKKGVDGTKSHNHPLTWPQTVLRSTLPWSVLCAPRKSYPARLPSAIQILKSCWVQLPKTHSLPWRSKQQRAGNQAKAVPEERLGGVWLCGS